MRVQIVSFHCVLKNNLGQLISSSFNQDVVTTPSPDSGAMLPEFVEALKVLKSGERRKISISADRAYGYYNPALQVTVSRKKLKDGPTLKVGDTVQGQSLQDGVMRTYRVSSATKTEVVLDANHPLAGQDLVFDVQMVSSHEENEQALISEAPSESVLLC